MEATRSRNEGHMAPFSLMDWAALRPWSRVSRSAHSASASSGAEDGDTAAFAAMSNWPWELDGALAERPADATDRLASWRDPFADPLGEGHQTIQSLYAIASGGLAGLGLGNSRQKYLYVPEPQNDFIFSILCEELGFIGAALVVALFLLLLLRGMSIAVRARDKFGALLTVCCGKSAQRRRPCFPG